MNDVQGFIAETKAAIARQDAELSALTEAAAGLGDEEIELSHDAEELFARLSEVCEAPLPNAAPAFGIPA